MGKEKESYSQAPFHWGYSSPAQGPGLFREEVTLNYQLVPENTIILKMLASCAGLFSSPSVLGDTAQGSLFPPLLESAADSMDHPVGYCLGLTTCPTVKSPQFSPDLVTGHCTCSWVKI